jgi:hypothetical protein
LAAVSVPEGVIYGKREGRAPLGGIGSALDRASSEGDTVLNIVEREV